MPKFKESAEMKGELKLVLKDKDGNVKEVREEENTLTELFDAHVADQLSDQGDTAIGYIAVGSGTGQTAASTGLATSESRVALDSTTQGTTGDDNDVIYVGTFDPGEGTAALTEAGIIQANNNTTMMAYQSFSAVNKTATDTLEITWTITFGAS